MTDIAEKQEYFKDHLIVRHPEGKSEKFSLPDVDGAVLKIGRELDNDIVLTDGRASRYHAELRCTPNGVEIKDLNSANGTLLNGEPVKAGVWQPLKAGQLVQLGETRLYWEKAASSQSTVVMPVQRPPDTRVSAKKPASESPAAPPTAKPLIPLAVGAGIIIILLALVGVGLMLGWFAPPPKTAEPPPTNANTPAGRDLEGGLAQQTPGAVIPTNTPTPTGPRLALPALDISKQEVRPFILQGLMSRDKVALVLNIRIQNNGNLPFTISTDNFTVKDLDNNTILNESGGNLSADALKRLGAINRFNNLTLSPGGSVVESVIFDLDPETYNLELVFKTDDLDPIILGLGTVQAGVELAKVLGTPLPETEGTAVAAAGPTPQPTPTPTLPASIPAPQVVSRSALVGTIAYAVFNGNNFDLYFGDVRSGATQLYRNQASQPAFNSDGSRIAFHSWAGDSRGLITMDVSGANAHLISNFIEDQLPTWTADSQDIVLLSRRSGGRQSQLIKNDSSTELGEGVILGEGEYPTIGTNGQMVFKGWGNTAFGLRLASADMTDIQTVTNVDEDTAPALSPDGSKVVFMSKRENDWNIYLINVDGSGLQRLTDDAADDGLPTWSPDGNAIAFVSNRGGIWAIWAMTPDGAGKRQLFTLGGSPDGFVGTDTYASRGWAEERISWTNAELVSAETE